MIKYSKCSNHKCIVVSLDGKQVGKILPVLEGFQYIPKGQTSGGEVYDTINEVKASIEGE